MGSPHNPLLDWTGPDATPALSLVKAEHFEPAVARALRDHARTVEEIGRACGAATLENTILPLERSRQAIDRISSMLELFAGTCADDEIRSIHRELSPKLSAYRSETFQDPVLCERVSALHERIAGYDEEQSRLIRRYYLDLTHAGANLGTESRARLETINRRLSTLRVTFSQNLFHESRRLVFPLEECQLRGLSDTARDGARAAAIEHGLGAPYAAVLTEGGLAPFMTFAADRDIRQTLYQAWIDRCGSGSPYSNRPIVDEVISLRAELATLLGHQSYAALQLVDRMATGLDQVRALLDNIQAHCRKRALWEQEQLRALAAAETGDSDLSPWDWRFYAQKVRSRSYDFDEAELRSYLPIENVIRAAFYTAQRLFGLSFRERDDIPVHHPDVRVWEVTRGGALLGIYYADYFARASKGEGAWMSTLRYQERMTGRVVPLVLNTFNFNSAPPVLLSLEEARTVFHEFGHALHGLLSDVRYPSLSGIRVALDYLELPSKIYERWLEVPEVLSRFATHYRTGKPLPAALIGKLVSARAFGRGAQTLSTVVASTLDIELHSMSPNATVNADAILANVLAGASSVPGIPIAYRPESFRHIFAAGYAAGFYAYLWCDVLAADAFEVFRDDPFDPHWAGRLLKNVYAVGGRRDHREAYRDFRGREPEFAPFLRERGLLD